MVKHFESDFAKEIAKDFLLVDFYANWCGPCQALAPVLEELEVDVLKVDVDAHQDLAVQYGVMSIPTLFIFKKGEIVSKRMGFQSKEELENWILENK